MEVKLCKDCKHYYRISGNSLCCRDTYTEESLIDGRATTKGYKPCVSERCPDEFCQDNENICGPEAKYFQPKE